MDPRVYFDDNFGKYGPILTIFSLLQQEIHDAQKLLFQPPHLYYVATLPSKTNTDAGINVIFLDHATKQISMYSNG